VAGGARSLIRLARTRAGLDFEEGGKLLAAERARVHALSHRRAHVGIRGVDAIARSRDGEKKLMTASIFLTALARLGSVQRDSRAAIRRTADGRRYGELSRRIRVKTRPTVRTRD
jgi:hypothetical protein